MAGPWARSAGPPSSRGPRERGNLEIRDVDHRQRGTANPALPARTIPEFIAYAKANPLTINMASAGM
jgi:hypothetical protein